MLLPSVLFAADTVTLSQCTVSAEDAVLVSAQEAGVLQEIPVREGQEVKTGELLAQIDDLIPRMKQEVAKYKLQVADKEAADTINITYSKLAAEVAKNELEKANEANRRVKNAYPDIEVQRLRLEKDKMVLSIDKAVKEWEVAALQKSVSKAELDAAQADMDHRKILSPLDGLVVELLRRKGEWVQMGDQVMRLVRIDVLRVRGELDASKYTPADIEDRPVQVTFTLPGGHKETLSGKVVFVKPVISAGDTFLVRAEVQNRNQNGRWLLNPGRTADMTIQLK